MTYTTTFPRVTDLRRCVGKTISAVVDDGDALGMRFTDNSWIWLQFEGDDGNCDAEYNPEYGWPWPTAALVLGIIDRDEFDRAFGAVRSRRLAAMLADSERLRKELEASEG